MPARQDQRKQEPNKGCVIEMDTVVLGGIPRLFGIIRDELSRQDVAIDEGRFARFLLGTYLENGLNRAMQGSGRRATPEMMQTIRSAYLAQLAEAEFHKVQGSLVEMKAVTTGAYNAGRMLRFTKPVTGGYYFAPSVERLLAL